MRDWNANVHNNPIITSASFDLTYEGLKYRNAGDCARVHLVLILPMRDWNKGFYMLYFLIVRVLILPMRDWNEYGKISHFTDWDVLILPMRDWNTVGAASFGKGFLFWSYLWGIEIPQPKSLDTGFRVFWSYLWGIEIKLRKTRKNWSFQFWSYLWGIEIGRWPVLYQGNSSFWSYLWGIEIVNSWQRYSLQFFVLILPMRDWNRRLVVYLELHLWVLILPMRDWNNDEEWNKRNQFVCFDLTYEGLK